MRPFFIPALFMSTLLCATAFCQPPPAAQNVVKVIPPANLKTTAGKAVKVVLSLQVDSGFHVNSNKPADPFLIPLRLTWSDGVLTSTAVTFPKPQLENYGFSPKPVSVFTNEFEIVTSFKANPNATPGASVLSGKLHYQACTENRCLPPKTIDVTLPVEIEP